MKVTNKHNSPGFWGTSEAQKDPENVQEGTSVQMGLEGTRAQGWCHVECRGGWPGESQGELARSSRELLHLPRSQFPLEWHLALSGTCHNNYYC